MAAVRLKNGAAFAVDWAGAAHGTLHIVLCKKQAEDNRVQCLNSLVDAVAVFGNPENVAEIVALPGPDMEDRFIGYTQLIEARIYGDDNDEIKIVLRKGGN